MRLCVFRYLGMSRLHSGRLLTLWLLLASASSYAAEMPLQAPFPVKLAHTEPNTAHAGVPCPEPVEPARDVMGVSFYTDAHHSIIDRRLMDENKIRMKPLSVFIRGLSQMTDQYLRSGDFATAHCAFLWLAHWAQAHAMLGHANRQGAYERQWTLGGLALSYLKIQHAPDLDHQARDQVEGWFRQLAAVVRAEYQHPERSDNRNNHVYWAGMAVAAVGIVTDDRGLFDWGLTRYRLGVAQIQDDGTLPLELARQGRALHYHLFALAPLVMLAEMGERNGMPLYQEQRGRLSLLVRRAVQGVRTPEAFGRLANATPSDPMPPQAGSHVAWAEIWLARFPDPELTQWIVDCRPVIDPRLGGNLTQLYASE
jgi:poly(beta-D-mannuronate) lyase